MINTIGWMVLVLMTLAISIWSLFLYVSDKDKRKLMFSIIFFISIFIFLFNAVDGLIQLPDTLLLSNLFQWLSLPAMTAILIAVVESFSPSKDFKKGFTLFIFFFLLSFSLVFLPLDTREFLKYIRIGIAGGIIPFSMYQYFKFRNIESLFLIFSVVSFSIAGLSHANNKMELSVFAYAIAYLFLFLMFFRYKSKEYMMKPGIGSYFSLEKQLKHIKTKLHESERLYEKILENTQDIILLNKPDGIISYVSPAYTKILGYSPEEIIHTNLLSLPIHPDDRNYVQEAVKKGYAGYPGNNLEYRVLTKEKDIRWISHSWSPIIEDNNVKTIVSSIKDITSLKQTQQRLSEQVIHLKNNELATLNIMEDFQDSISSLKQVREQIQESNTQLQESQEELKKLNLELEQRVQERTEEINKLLKQKNSFIYQLGHDLKNPLGPLISLLPLLKRHEQDPKYLEMLEIIERNTEYMKNLVSKTLTLARLSSSNIDFHFESVNLEDTITDILTRNSIFFQEKNVQIDTDVPKDLEVSVDKLQFDELLTNLLNNAVKYSSDPAKIHVSALKDADNVIVSVSDNGIGMTQEQIQFLFDEFYKADPSRHDFESNGLGLAIVKRIIEQHGGRVWAESEGLGKGSIFYFTLPKKDSAL